MPSLENCTIQKGNCNRVRGSTQSLVISTVWSLHTRANQPHFRTEEEERTIPVLLQSYHSSYLLNIPRLHCRGMNNIIILWFVKVQELWQPSVRFQCCFVTPMTSCRWMCFYVPGKLKCKGHFKSLCMEVSSFSRLFSVNLVHPELVTWFSGMD